MITLLMIENVQQELLWPSDPIPYNYVYVDRKTGDVWARWVFHPIRPFWPIACERGAWFAIPSNIQLASKILSRLKGEVLRREFLAYTNNLGDLL